MVPCSLVWKKKCHTEQSLHFSVLSHHGRMDFNGTFCALEVFPLKSMWCQCSLPEFGSSVFYLLWFSEASIMALNLDFSSASKAAGESNSKTYEMEKTEKRSAPAS